MWSRLSNEGLPSHHADAPPSSSSYDDDDDVASYLHTHIYRLKTIGGIFRRMFGALAPSKRLSWTEAFEEEFGRKHPTYIEAPSLLQAATLARANCKFLIVYLPSHSARDEKKHKAFCRTLTDPDVSK